MILSVSIRDWFRVHVVRYQKLSEYPVMCALGKKNIKTDASIKIAKFVHLPFGKIQFQYIQKFSKKMGQNFPLKVLEMNIVNILKIILEVNDLAFIGSQWCGPAFLVLLIFW